MNIHAYTKWTVTCGSLGEEEASRGRRRGRVQLNKGHTRSPGEASPRGRGPATILSRARSMTLPQLPCLSGGGVPQLGPHPRPWLRLLAHSTGAYETGHARHCSAHTARTPSLVSVMLLTRTIGWAPGTSQEAWRARQLRTRPSTSGLTMLSVSWSRSSSSSSQWGWVRFLLWYGQGPERLDLLEDLASPPLGFSEKSYKVTVTCVRLSCSFRLLCCVKPL